MKRSCLFASGVIMAAALAAPVRAAEAGGLDSRYRGREISDIAERLPFAYYPSRNQLEVAVQAPFAEPIAAQHLVPAAGPEVNAANGLRGDYFEGRNFDKKILSRLDPTVNFEWGDAAPDPRVPADEFSVRWEGWVVPESSGEYAFLVPGCTRLFVNNKRVADQWASENRWGSGWLALEAGKRYAIKMEYFNGRGTAVAGLHWTKKIPVKDGQVTVQVVPAGGGKPVATGKVALDADGRGQELIDVPDLPDGTYAVEYQMGGKTAKASQTFERIHFPWENNRLGNGHKVYAPYTPVKVDGNRVSVVDRTYTMNAFGLFDSVVSKDRELLAGPIAVVCETADGREKWTAGTVSGAAKHDDQAVFSCQAGCGPLSVDSVVEVEEDGCAKISMKLVPPAKPREIRRLWIEIPLNDGEVPLFHFCVEGGIRFNYGGTTPRGRNIVWDVAKKGWWPVTWSADPGPDDAVLWDATKTRTFMESHKRPFVPYVWLGAEERGLAWFAETDRFFVTDRKQPVQTLSRENGVVYLRIHLAQMPFVLDQERTLVFGLQASPTKPMEKGWRTRTYASGVGPVVCWGGYDCGSKYPDRRDFTIVDKIQEARETRKVDKAWFEERDKYRRDPEDKVHGSKPWLQYVMAFANSAPSSGHAGSGTYFEEHCTETKIEEWRVFQDEWSSSEFHRFRQNPRPQCVARPSYHDFALFYANEWMKRGVSLYFDNTYMKLSRNRRFSAAYVPTADRLAALLGAATRPDIAVPDHLAELVRGALPEGGIQWCSEIFGPRAYYRRIWKLSREWNENGAPYPIDVTFHMTNTALLPFSAWCTAVLELEQDTPGEPWPSDYVRAVIMHRRSGAMTNAHYFMTGQSNRVPAEKLSDESMLAAWGMAKVHDIQAGADMRRKIVSAYHRAFLEFGYGKDDVAHCNYWDEKPSALVADDRVKWLAMHRQGTKPGAMILLQSYAKDAATTRVTVPGAVRYEEIHTGEVLTADDKGSAEVALPANYGTRLYRIELR